MPSEVRPCAIRAHDVRKVYHLYASRRDRVLDMVGLLGSARGGREFAALDGVSLEIARGEKVAVIGRNGAGKSTLLKLVSRVTQPTSGTLEVSGTVHALLQIGTGFHPDFTGRQNVSAYFAQLGITGADADRRLEDVVEFAELADYIDQPVATYSTGMAVRLMFGASTAIVPDLLLLDEVLGVGDAYFAHKSFERISAMCANEGTTLLLVTHDLYSAARVCSRIVWLDHGRVLLDGDAGSVVKAYEESIRHQEEARLRGEKQRRLQAYRGSTGASDAQMLVEVRNGVSGFLPCPVYFSCLECHAGGRTASAAPFGADAFDDRLASHLEPSASAWGDATIWHTRAARPFLNFGSPFQKVVAVLAVPLDGQGALPEDLAVRLDCWAASSCTLEVRGFASGREWDGGAIALRPGEWLSRVAVLHPRGESRPLVGDVTGIHGTGAIAIDDVRSLDAAGAEKFSFAHGDPFELEVSFRIQAPDLRERVQVLVAFLKNGIHDVCRVITRDLLFDAAMRPSGAVRVRIPRLALSPGSYAISVLMAREGYYDQPQATYFSVNPDVHACVSRVLEIGVHGGGNVAAGTVIVADGEWSIIAAADDRPVTARP